jgi:VIT family protein
LAYLLPWFEGVRFIAASALALTTLFAVGAGRASFTKRGWFVSGLEMLLIGALAERVAYGIGALVAAVEGESSQWASLNWQAFPPYALAHTAVKVLSIRLPSCGRCGRRSGLLIIDVCGFTTNDKVDVELYSQRLGDQLGRRPKQAFTLSEFNAAEYQAGGWDWTQGSRLDWFLLL